MSRFPGFIGGSYVSQSPIADCEQTVNWYVAPLESPGAKNKAALYPTPGQRTFVTVADVGGRALFANGGRLFAVVGSGLYEVFENATTTNRGTVAQDNNPATLSTNGAAGNELFITSGGQGYVMNLTTHTVTTVLASGATMGGMMDGYFLAFDAATPQFLVSGLNDGLTWDPLQYAQRSIAPDPWKAMITADKLGAREIWLIGERTGEVWYDAGAYPFPFMPIPGALFKFGTPAPFSLAAAADRVIWLSQSAEGAGIVVSAKGYNPEPISTKALETAIARYQRTSTIADAEAFSYQLEGHTFYCLRFPTANATHTFDLTTGLWCDQGTWIAASGRFDAWHPRVHAYAFGQHLVAEAGSGTICVLDTTIGTERDGSAIRRVRRAPGICDEHRQIPYPRLELYLEAGLGLVSGQGSDPLVMLRQSNDGGKTWGPERTMSAGTMGAYSTRVYANRCGMSRDRVFEISVSDPVPWRIIDAYLDNTSPRRG